MLQNLQKNTRSYITLDDLDRRLFAEQKPIEFVDRFKQPVPIDEVQYAPGLFLYIKMMVDKTKKPGVFWLTGSQQFSMMKCGEIRSIR